jgi:undecaprenyl-diphosphatase
MMTLVGGYWVGLKPKAAAEFSFLLGLLTLSAASAYSGLKSWQVIRSELELGPVLLGLAVATVVAFTSIRWLLGFLTRHGLVPFAIYRLILALCILSWVQP